jgi:hypothetical protein
MSLAERDARGRWLPGVGSGAREIPIAPLREAFERSGLTAAEVARRLDWYDHHGRPDGHRVRRALGMRPVGFGKGYGNKCIKTTSYERAVMLAEAIGVLPIDVEL